MKRKQWIQLFETPDTPKDELLKTIRQADTGLINSVNTEGRSALMLSILSNFAPVIIQALLDKGADISYVAGDGITPLMVAAAHAVNPEILEMLIARGAKVSGRDPRGAGLAMYAAINLRTDHSVLLTAHGCDRTLMDHNGQNALHWAIRADQPVERVSTLIDLPLSPHRNDEHSFEKDSLGYTSYISAIPSALILSVIYSSSINVVDLLLSSGADIEEKDTEFSRTALMYAVMMECSTNRLLELLERGARIDTQDIDGMTPLMLAARHNSDTQIYRFLLRHQADASMKDARGRTARDIAKHRGVKRFEQEFRIMIFEEEWERFFSLIESAPEHEAFLTLSAIWETNRQSIREKLLVPMMVSIKEHLPVDIIHRLLEAGADIEARNEENLDTPLLYSCRYTDSFEYTRVLLEAGSDVKARDRIGRQALTLAILNNFSPAAIQEFLEAGAPLESKDRNARTAFHSALEHQTPEEILALLVHGGADIDARDSNNQSALIQAVERGASSNTILYLLDLGVDVNIRDKKEHKTALLYALQSSIDQTLIISHLIRRDSMAEKSLVTLLYQLRVACMAPAHMNLLLATGLNIDSPDAQGETVLMHKAYLGEIEEVKALLGFGSNVTVKDNEGLTAFLHFINGCSHIYWAPSKMSADVAKHILKMIQVLIPHDTVSHVNAYLRDAHEWMKIASYMTQKNIELSEILHPFREAGAEDQGIHIFEEQVKEITSFIQGLDS